MTELEKLAHDYAKPEDYQAYRNGQYEGFLAGFRKARDMAVKIWENAEHTDCEFAVDGFTMLDFLGEHQVK